jgi:hypothetical protein
MSTFQLDPNNVPLGVPSLGTTQIFTVTNSSVQSTAFGANTTMIRLSCSLGHCHIAIGANPTANLTTSAMIPNNFSEIVRVSPGHKIAVIKDATTTSSTLSVTELV